MCLECYHATVRQLITRIDDDLHRRLKERALAEGRSVNALVTDLLEVAVPPLTPRRVLRARLRALGRLVEPPLPKHVPTWDEVVAAGRGAGTAASEALAAERARR